MLQKNIHLRFESLFRFFRDMKCFFEYQALQFSNEKSLLLEHDIYQKIQVILKQQFPSDGLLVEDYDYYMAQNDFTWFLDPIDGTSNMLTGVSFFSISLCLVYQNHKPVLSFILDCNTGLLHIAKEEDNRTFSLNENRYITTSKNTQMSTHEYILIGRVFGHYRKQKIHSLKDYWWDLALQSNSYRQLGSIALQMVLDGLKRQTIVFIVGVRWFDVVAAMHILRNVGYEFRVSKDGECLLVCHPNLIEAKVLGTFVQGIEHIWDFLPWNQWALPPNILKRRK